MMIQTNEVTNRVVGGSEYKYVEMTCGKHSALVLVASGNLSYVRVIVKNASNRVWRGFGKQFKTSAEAIENYK